ncbi:hypothetical protein ASG39_11225 [Rhizobium sp. Leaf371]|uniref:hypothetical protein n=1 Tax=Rhizobium sp. Leaf371 TaxID=1736355 RepID=UPI0007137553|nr:hypothetical protein [Rhizobium sp. Leaf371]KQS64519.1 hypothetical protein ASG39_11225 [Rhizobium sp. Leaf371]
MTPAERARLVDQEEFAAECAAIRQRAYAAVVQRQEALKAKLDRWLDRTSMTTTPAQKPKPLSAVTEPKRERRKPGTKPRLYTAFGVSKSRSEWAADMGVSVDTLATRMHRLGSLEAALNDMASRPTGNRQRIAGIVSAFRSIRNRVLIQRITSTFRPHTPGYVQTSSQTLGTGLGSRAVERGHLEISLRTENQRATA